jgi:prepilin-type N-terminal cleavage/methylation domain-containing protein
MKDIRRNSGFTIVELMIGVMIVAVLATLAIPRIFTVIESSRATEGEQFLYAILAAQKRYSLDNDNGDNTPDYASDLDDLDVTVSGQLENFDTPDDTTDVNTATPAVWIARITRKNNPYTLFINEAGIIRCNCNGSACPTCTKMGYATQP